MQFRQRVWRADEHNNYAVSCELEQHQHGCNAGSSCAPCLQIKHTWCCSASHWTGPPRSLQSARCTGLASPAPCHPDLQVVKSRPAGVKSRLFSCGWRKMQTHSCLTRARYVACLNCWTASTVGLPQLLDSRCNEMYVAGFGCYLEMSSWGCALLSQRRPASVPPACAGPPRSGALSPPHCSSRTNIQHHSAAEPEHYNITEPDRRRQRRNSCSRTAPS